MNRGCGPGTGNSVDEGRIQKWAVRGQPYDGIGRVCLERRNEAGQDVVLAAADDSHPQGVAEFGHDIVPGLGRGGHDDCVDLGGRPRCADHPLQHRSTA